MPHTAFGTVCAARRTSPTFARFTATAFTGGQDYYLPVFTDGFACHASSFLPRHLLPFICVRFCVCLPRRAFYGLTQRALRFTHLRAGSATYAPHTTFCRTHHTPVALLRCAPARCAHRMARCRFFVWFNRFCWINMPAGRSTATRLFHGYFVYLYLRRRPGMRLPTTTITPPAYHP